MVIVLTIVFIKITHISWSNVIYVGFVEEKPAVRHA
jgi:hypothetical protein